MTTNSSFHPPIVLADARERRARRQRPYPSCVELKDLQDFEGAGVHESAQRDVRTLLPAMAAAVVVLLVLVAVTLHHFLGVSP
jgi:hypothetical protein